MTEQLAYLTDPLTLEFEAQIVDKTKVDDGHVDIILETTYFYPTGGGQSHDTGTLGPGRVVDVFKDDAGRVVHRVDRDIAGPTVAGKIDYDRRLGHMQHHTAQHMVSRAFEAQLNLDTLSARISAGVPSTVDLPLAGLSLADLERVEWYVNGIVFENRPIKTYFISDAQLHTVPFRRPPKVSGQIRVVEIEGFDYSACGGTHCLHTGMVGLIKMVKTETKNKKLRVHFVAGGQALAYFQQAHDIVTELSRNFSSGPDSVVALVNQQAEQLRQAQKVIKQLTSELLPLEAQQLLRGAETFEGYRLILARFEDRPPEELRELGNLLRAEDGVIAVLAGYSAPKLSLVVCCADDTGVSAKALLTQQLASLGGRGGGDAKMAQGGGGASPEQMDTFFENTRAYILELK